MNRALNAAKLELCKQLWVTSVAQAGVRLGPSRYGLSDWVFLLLAVRASMHSNREKDSGPDTLSRDATKDAVRGDGASDDGAATDGGDVGVGRDVGADSGAPTCSDGIKNGGELGADCGGPCARVCVDYDCASGQNQIPAVECEKLKDLYTAASGAKWTKITGWFATSTPCNWDGVTCEGAAPTNVSQLSIREDNMSGVLVRGLDTFSKLTAFQMGADAGGTTNLGGVFPTELLSLPGLSTLRLQRNRLTGQLPANVGDSQTIWGDGYFGEPFFGRRARALDERDQT